MKNVSAGVLSVVAALALVVGASSPALAVSNPKVHPKPQIVATGTLTVQLVDLQGHDITDLDVDPTTNVVLSSADSDFFSSYAAASKDDANNEGPYAGPLVHGLVTFTDVPINNSFTLAVSGGAYPFKKVTGIYASSSVVRIPLTRVATISGTLLTTTSAPLAGAAVTVFNTKGGLVGSVTTGDNGGYSIDLKSGTYRVQFNSPSGPPSTDTDNFRWSYWGGSTYKTAKQLVVHGESKTKSASVLTAISARVAPSIPVTVNQWVIDPDGSAAISAGLEFISTSAAGDSKEVAFQTSDADSAMTTGLNPGKYKVEFVSYNYDFGTYNDWWYTGEKKIPSHSSSKAVTVTVPTSGSVTFNLGVPPTPST